MVSSSGSRRAGWSDMAGSGGLGWAVLRHMRRRHLGAVGDSRPPMASEILQFLLLLVSGPAAAPWRRPCSSTDFGRGATPGEGGPMALGLGPREVGRASGGEGV